MFNTDRGLRRKRDFVHAIRKMAKCDKFPWYDNLHQYSKNKIHCSCPMCSPKTRNKGNRRHGARGWEHSINYKISDLRKHKDMDYQEEEAIQFMFGRVDRPYDGKLYM